MYKKYLKLKELYLTAKVFLLKKIYNNHNSRNGFKTISAMLELHDCINLELEEINKRIAWQAMKIIGQ